MDPPPLFCFYLLGLQHGQYIGINTGPVGPLVSNPLELTDTVY